MTTHVKRLLVDRARDLFDLACIWIAIWYLGFTPGQSYASAIFVWYVVIQRKRIGD